MTPEAAPRTIPNGERLYRAWWHIHWSKGNSLHPQWEQLDPSVQRTWLTLGEAEAAAGTALPSGSPEPDGLDVEGLVAWAAARGAPPELLSAAMRAAGGPDAIDSARVREPAYMPPWDEPIARPPDLYAAIQIVRAYLGMATPEQLQAEEDARVARLAGEDSK
jgi:hypothetical protein